MIEQTALIHDVLRLQTDFHLSGIEPEDSVRDYRWFLISSPTCIADDEIFDYLELLALGPGYTAVAKWNDQTWFGVWDY